MSDLPLFLVGEEFALTLVPPAGFVLPAGVPVFSIDNASLAALNDAVSPPTLTLLAPGTVNITCVDGSVTATLALSITEPVATSATIVLTPVTPAA